MRLRKKLLIWIMHHHRTEYSISIRHACKLIFQLHKIISSQIKMNFPFESLHGQHRLALNIYQSAFVKGNTVNYDDTYKYPSVYFLCLVAVSVIKLMIGTLTQNYMQNYMQFTSQTHHHLWYLWVHLHSLGATLLWMGTVGHQKYWS